MQRRLVHAPAPIIGKRIASRFKAVAAVAAGAAAAVLAVGADRSRPALATAMRTVEQRLKTVALTVQPNGEVLHRLPLHARTLRVGVAAVAAVDSVATANRASDSPS